VSISSYFLFAISFACRFNFIFPSIFLSLQSEATRWTGHSDSIFLPIILVFVVDSIIISSSIVGKSSSRSPFSNKHGKFPTVEIVHPILPLKFSKIGFLSPNLALSMKIYQQEDFAKFSDGEKFRLSDFLPCLLLRHYWNEAKGILILNKKAQLLLGKVPYSLYSSCCSTDLQCRPRSKIFISSERVYAISINSNLGPISHRFPRCGQFSVEDAHFSHPFHTTPNFEDVPLGLQC